MIWKLYDNEKSYIGFLIVWINWVVKWFDWIDVIEKLDNIRIETCDPESMNKD